MEQPKFTPEQIQSMQLKRIETKVTRLSISLGLDPNEAANAHKSPKAVWNGDHIAILSLDVGISELLNLAHEHSIGNVPVPIKVLGNTVFYTAN